MISSIIHLLRGKMIVILSYYLLLAGCVIASCASTYDYSASIECLDEPLPPQYEGGLVGNPDFSSGSDEWIKFGNGKITLRESNSGNSYMVAYNRKLAIDSFSHVFYVQKDLLYTFSAWFQVNKGKEIISAFLEYPNGTSLIVGSVIAKSGCWSMLKGGFTVEEDMHANIYFVCKNTEVEVWIDSASLKQFTKTEWQDQQKRSIDKIRKRKVRIHVTSQEGLQVGGANVTIDQTRPKFLLGCGVGENILTDKAYQDYFTSRFRLTSFHNEMKWYFTQPHPYVENYTIPDAMVSFFKKNGIPVRGHTILWASPNMTQYWIKWLPDDRAVLNAAVKHTASVVSRYLGGLIGWDVMNENLHYSFYEEKLGPNASAMFHQIVRAMDPGTPLHLNEYNVLEYPMDLNVIPSKYVERIREIRSFPGNENMVLKIGLQGHFLLKPNVSHVRASFDVLAATGMPIWITELDTKRGPKQAEQLEDVMRESFAHPGVEAMIVWGGWKPTACSEKCLADENYDVLPKGCAEMCLIDGNMKNLPAGDVVDKLIKEWTTTNVSGITGEDGVFEHKVFLGQYSLSYSHPEISGTVNKTFNVTSGKGPLDLWVSL